MSDKGVRNNHKGHITVSNVIKVGDEEVTDLILKPGFNRLTVEQYRAIKAVPVIGNYFKVKLLEDVSVTDATEDEAEEGKPEGKPLEKMNKEELKARAAELKLTVADDATNADLRDAIRTATAQ